MVSAETAQNQKWRSLVKGVFGMGEEVFFTNRVFEKLCSAENVIFIVFSAKHSSCGKNMHVEKTENLWK